MNVYFRSQFYLFMDTMIHDLTEKLHLVTDTIRPFLYALNPKKPGPVEATKSLIGMFPAVFPEDMYIAIHNKLQAFFAHIMKEYEQITDGEEQHQVLTVGSAGYYSMKISRDHSLFKSVATLYQLFLTAAPSVCKMKEHLAP